MAQVHFFDYSKRRNIPGGMERLIMQSDIMKVIHKGDSVAIKTHMCSGYFHQMYFEPTFPGQYYELQILPVRSFI